MQYNESDLDFLKRLWAREGISFVLMPAAESTVEHPQHALVLFDEPRDLDANVCGVARFHRADGTEARDAITQWRARRCLQTAAVARSSWNHETASILECAEGCRQDQGEHGQALASTLEEYRHDAPLEDGEAGLLESRALARRHALEGQAKHFEGESSMRSFQAGSWFTFTQHPVHDLDPEHDFLILSLETTAVNNLPKGLAMGPAALLSRETRREPPCSNRFTCVRRGIPVLPGELPPPRPGLLSARVVGPGHEEVHVDELHRIKVRFLFTRPQEHLEAGAGDTDADSAWVRLAQVWSSQGFGSSFLPRVGDEVLIQFAGGDPYKPLAAGCLRNGLKPPTAFSGASALPADRTLSGLRSSMFKGTGGNELVFDDAPKELRVRLACDHLASQLCLGCLAKPRCGGASVPLGEGFELKTQGWGALRTARGMLLTADGGLEDQLESALLTNQLGSSLELAKTLSEAGGQHLADRLEANAALTSVRQTLEGRKHLGSGGQARRVAAFPEPMLALSSPTGIVSATRAKWVLSAQQHLHATADQSLRVVAIQGTLELLARNGITLTTPGAMFQLKDGEISIEGRTCNVHCAGVHQVGPQHAHVELPKLPKATPAEQRFPAVPVPGRP